MSGDRLANQSIEVNGFLLALQHPLLDEIDALRLAILASNADIAEHIKWNAPSFRYRGDDRVTFRLPPKGGLQLIFHRGAKVKDATGFAFDDDTGLMRWAAADRAVVTLGDGPTVTAQTSDVVGLVNRWLDATT